MMIVNADRALTSCSTCAPLGLCTYPPDSQQAHHVQAAQKQQHAAYIQLVGDRVCQQAAQDAAKRGRGGNAGDPLFC